MKKNKILWGLIVILFAAIACTDELDKLPLDQITSESYWNTTTDLELYVNQFYPSAFSVSGSDRYENLFAADIETDDMSHVQEALKLQGTRTVPTSGGWNYGTIRSVNYFLANYTKCQSDFEEYKKYVGEAYFFRAFYYFDLLKEYGDVPYIGKPLGTDSEELYMARTPRTQVADSIIADLDVAIDYLPSGKQEGSTRLNKEIAQLFKSRVGLYEGTWEKYHSGTVFGIPNSNPQKFLQLASEAANDVIKSGLYNIYATGDKDWDYFFFAEVDYSNNPEVLLWKKYDISKGVGHARQFQIATGMSGGMGLTKSLVESYLCTDGNPIFTSDGVANPLYRGDDDLKRVIANRDPRLKQTIFTPGFPLQIAGSDTSFFTRPSIDQPAHTVCPTGYQINKTLNFDGIHHASLETRGVGFTGWIMFRYAEALLNYAEAKAELGTINQSDIDKTIKLLRDRAGMPNLIISEIKTDPNWIFPDLPPVINEIRRERRVELIAEGFRWDDIARWAAADEVIVGKRPLGGKFNSIDYPDLSAEDYLLTDGYFDYLKIRLPDGYGFVVGRDYLSPISTEELTLNENLIQNPGW